MIVALATLVHKDGLLKFIIEQKKAHAYDIVCIIVPAEKVKARHRDNK